MRIGTISSAALLLLAGLLLFQPLHLCLAAEKPADDEQAIQRYRINIGKLREGIKSHLEMIKESGRQEGNLLDELSRIDKKIALQKQKVGALQDRLVAQEHLLILKEKDLTQARDNKEHVRKHLQHRLRSFYTMGKTGFLNITFSTENLPALLRFNDSYMRLLEYDQSVILMYRETIDQLKRAKKAQELEKSLLADFIDQADKERQALDEAKAEKENLLVKIRTRKSLYEQALKEMKKAEVALAASLVQMKKEERLKTEGFVLNKGKLPAPVAGNLIRRFGDKKKGPDTTDIVSKGITVEAADNTPVMAIFAGQVLFAGYMNGYGNLVIIDHGLQYYTVTARLESIAVKEKQYVAAGEVIGRAGDIATLFEKGLYFEIRHGSQAVDPLAWIDGSRFSADNTPQP